MKKQRIYLDTSIFGGYFDKEFDAVKFAREQKDKLSVELSKMNKEEIVAYFKKIRLESKIKPST